MRNLIIQKVFLDEKIKLFIIRKVLDGKNKVVY